MLLYIKYAVDMQHIEEFLSCVSLWSAYQRLFIRFTSNQRSKDIMIFVKIFNVLIKCLYPLSINIFDELLKEAFYKLVIYRFEC